MLVFFVIFVVVYALPDRAGREAEVGVLPSVNAALNSLASAFLVAGFMVKLEKPPEVSNPSAKVVTVRAPPARAVELSMTHILMPMKSGSATVNMLLVMTIHFELTPKPGKSAQVVPDGKAGSAGKE